MQKALSTYIIKQHAKRAMRGRFFKAVSACFLPAAIIFVITMMIFSFIPGGVESVELVVTGDFPSVEAQVEYQMSVLTNVIYCFEIITALFYFLIIGGTKMMLEMVRGEAEVKIKTIFSFYDNWYVAMIMPFVMLLFSFGGNLLVEYMLRWGVGADEVSFVALVLNIILAIFNVKTLFFSYALADSGCTSFWGAFKKSWKMVNFRTFINVVSLAISFFGWIILAAFTGGVLFFYVAPYMSLSMATVYVNEELGMRN